MAKMTLIELVDGYADAAGEAGFNRDDAPPRAEIVDQLGFLREFADNASAECRCPKCTARAITYVLDGGEKP